MALLVLKNVETGKFFVETGPRMFRMTRSLEQATLLTGDQHYVAERFREQYPAENLEIKVVRLVEVQ